MSKELLPCPFCGGRAITLNYYPYSATKVPVNTVKCEQCRANSGDWSKMDSAIEAWNRRTFTPLVNITEEVRNMRDRGWCDQSTVLDKVNDDISKEWNRRK